MIRTIRIAFVLCLAFVSQSLAGERDGIVETFARLQPSVGALYAQDGNGDLKFLCSATAIERHGGDTVVLTAYHCMRKGVSYLINFGDSVLRPLRVWKVPHYEVDEKEFPRRFGEPETDMALMLMEGHDVPVVAMAASSQVTTGTRVATVGFPLGVAKIAYEGSVAGRFDRPGNDQDDYMLLQIFGAPGSSGSAVVDVDSGEIVSVLVSAKQSIVGLPVIFATPVEYRRHLMAVRSDKEVGISEPAEPTNAP